MDIITTYGGLWKELIQFSLFFFSQRVQIIIRICNTIVQYISAICIFLRKLKTKSLVQAPTVSLVISFPISSQALIMSFTLLKTPQQRPFCWAPLWQRCLPLAGLYSLSFHHHRCQLLFPSGLPDLSWFCLSPAYIQTLAHPWVLCPSRWAWIFVSKWGVGWKLVFWRVHLCIQASPAQGINFIPLISLHCIAFFTLSANLMSHSNVASASNLPMMLPLFAAHHCIYKSN